MNAALAAFGAAVMLPHLEKLLDYEAGARSGHDPEDVHRMRVAARRLRSANRAFGPAIAASGCVGLEEADAALRTLAVALSPVRDGDVFLEQLRRDGAQLPSEDRPALERLVADYARALESARGNLRSGLDGPDIAWLRDVWLPRLEALAAKGVAGAAIRRPAAELIETEYRRLHRRWRRLRTPTVDHLHRLRIAAKRFRYACELLAPACAASLDDAIAAATRLQDTLGALNDDEVAIGLLLDCLERIAREGHQLADGGAIARLIALRRARRDQLCARLPGEWTALPSGRILRRRLRGRAT